MWTKKHEKFALAVNLSECQQYLLRDILRKSKSSQPSEIEIDLRDTNKWIGKHRWRGQYHRTTIIRAIAALDQKTMGMVVIVKRYNPYVYKLLVRPLYFVEKIQSSSCASALKPTTENPMFDGDRKEKSRELLLQNISKLETLFSKLGMKYTSDALHRIWRYAGRKMESVSSAVEYMLRVHKDKIERSGIAINEEPKGIQVPQGWLHDCLKFGWHIDNTYDVKLPYFDTINALCGFVKDISPPTPPL